MNRNFLYVVILVFIVGCAPRDNPFDPLSPYAFAGIYGRVTNLRGDVAISGAMVAVDGDQFTVTDSAGNFVIFVDEGEHRLSVSGNDILELDTVLFSTKGERDTVILRVDRLPVISYAVLSSEHIASAIAGDSYVLHAVCSASDPDGVYEMDSVLLLVGDTAFMMDERAEDTFAVAVPDSLLPFNIHNLIGVPMHVVAKDIHGGVRLSEDLYLARIIQRVPEAIAPIGGVTAPPRPMFVWHSLDVEYPVTYDLELYRAPIGQVPTLVMRAVGIQDTTFQMEDSLSSGFYYWVIFGVDDFGDRSRSIEYLFMVQ